MYMCLLIEGSNKWLKLLIVVVVVVVVNNANLKTILGIRWL